MPSFDPGVREEFGPDTIAQFVVPETDEALLSVHTWVVRTPRKTILVDTCNLVDGQLMPAHFSAPHAFTVTTRGDGFAVVDAL